MCIKPRATAGFTLIELIISIVILSIALVSIMAVYTRAVLNSVDPMLQQQAVAIAEAYMEEISGLGTGKDNSCTETSTGTSNRGSWRYIFDYNGLSEDAGPKTIHGETIAELADYRVSVEIEPSPLNGVPGCWIQITVTHDRFSAIGVDLQGFRALDNLD
ncbi:type IV pilus modification PilV family protein [Thiorhodospira sibirica]|uniref:type IV pilus modification PilV family protein n=1 Tax=Thiorhodospira sibirica TaxID=154347 RepID=UPI00022C11CE|nr:prepilin-type N-terminal cleavage/methylation domain-containing protein [Thiorhodospira sibirica]